MPGARLRAPRRGTARADRARGGRLAAGGAVRDCACFRRAPPLALDAAGLARVRDAFVDAARRADRIGIDAIEPHAAHGYLLHQFLSPLANRRGDEYGGSLENRMRFPLEVFEAVRAVFPAGRPVGVRVSATDWVEAAGTPSSPRSLRMRWRRGLRLPARVERRRVAAAAVPIGPGYQVHLAARLRGQVKMPVIAVGRITEPEQAETIIASGQADLVGIARAILFEPHWPWRAAGELGAQVKAPRQYWRSQPRAYKSLFGDVRIAQR